MEAKDFPPSMASVSKGNIPRDNKFFESKFGDWRHSEKILRMLCLYAASPGGYLLLCGENGTGKTHAARVIYQCNARFTLPAYDHDEAYFTTQADLNRAFGEYQSKFGDTCGLHAKCTAAKLLVIDDLGTRIPTDAFMDFLYAVFDKRYENRAVCATVITTNLSPDDISTKFGSAIASRICSGQCYGFGGNDRRNS